MSVRTSGGGASRRYRIAGTASKAIPNIARPSRATRAVMVVRFPVPALRSEARMIGETLAREALAAGNAAGVGAPLSTNRRTPATKDCHAGSFRSPLHCERSAVWVSSNMIGRLHGSIITGTRVLLSFARIASARTQRESTDFFDHRTTTALASRSAFSVIWSKASPGFSVASTRC